MKSVYANLPDYSEIIHFRDNFEPVDGLDAQYEWAEGYAKARLDQLTKDFEYLDSKAGFVFTFVGGGFGVLTVGSLAMPFAIPWWVVALLVFPISAAIVALCFAMKARRVEPQPALPTVEKVTQYVAYFKERSRRYLLGEWHFANEIMKRINDEKSWYVMVAGKAGIISVVLLTVPFVGGVVWRVNTSSVSLPEPLRVVIEKPITPPET